MNFLKESDQKIKKNNNFSIIFFYTCKSVLNQLWNLSAAYYLNLRFQYTISGIDMDNELLTALRNVIYKIVSDSKIVSICLQEIC